MDYIIGIGTILLGGGLISKVVMYLFKRYDERQARLKKIIEDTLKNLSEYGKSLNKAYNIWKENVPEIINYFEEYLNHLRNYNENLRFLHREYKDVIGTAEECVCKFAELCPRRLNNEEPSSELIEYCDKTHKLYTNFTTNQKALNDNIISLINAINDVLADYDDVLNHFPEIYTLKKKIREVIITKFITIQQANSKINIGIINIKSDPINNFGEENNLLGELILEAIKKVEYTKLKLAQTLR